jgi:hypothetical protein
VDHEEDYQQHFRARGVFSTMLGPDVMVRRPETLSRGPQKMHECSIAGLGDKTTNLAARLPLWRGI